MVATDDYNQLCFYAAKTDFIILSLLSCLQPQGTVGLLPHAQAPFLILSLTKTIQPSLHFCLGWGRQALGTNGVEDPHQRLQEPLTKAPESEPWGEMGKPPSTPSQVGYPREAAAQGDVDLSLRATIPHPAHMTSCILWGAAGSIYS